jgi:hypothetical protein
MPNPLIMPQYTVRQVARVGKKVNDAIQGEPSGLACEALMLILLTELRAHGRSDATAKAALLEIFDRTRNS